MRTFQAVNPATNQFLDGEFEVTEPAQIDEVVQKAVAAFDIYRKKSKEDIARFLEQAATEIENLGDELLERCHLETALPMGRLQGERGRTMGQLRLFAAVVREGSWVDARVDYGNPERQPFPKPDVRQMLRPLGPVAVFGASNFPLAFSTAGGDTASALAAGCPVIVKGHPAHPGTAQLVAQALQKAAASTGMPEGTFALVQGNDFAVGEYLVKHPDIKAVGFTGSFRGGKAIFDYANSRPEPIPVFAEMGSTNPVFILPGALADRAEDIGAGLAASINLGVGQFCTNPGLSFVQAGANTAKLRDALAGKITESPAGTMLTSGIKSAYDSGTDGLSNITNVETLASGEQSQAPNTAVSKVFQTNIQTFFEYEALVEEVFGPSSIVIEYSDKEELYKAANSLHGHLTATVHATDKDMEEHRPLFEILEKKVGRLIINGYPTGVEVCHAMVHGGPYPATTASQTTSVGTNAIKRFVRPVCYQDFPNTLLPKALQNDNPLNLWRLVDGEITKS